MLVCALDFTPIVGCHSAVLTSHHQEMPCAAHSLGKLIRACLQDHTSRDAVARKLQVMLAGTGEYAMQVQVAVLIYPMRCADSLARHDAAELRMR